MTSSNNNIRSLDNLIDYGNTSDISETKCITYRKSDGIIFADDYVYDKYRDILNSYKRTVTLDTTNQKKYIYHPDRFCSDVYGNINLYHIILYMNGCSEADFGRNNTITYIDPNAVENIIPLILANESSVISDSKSKLTK